MEEFFTTEMVGALKELGAVAWLGILSWQAIRMRKNGNVNNLEAKIDQINERIFRLAESVARIEGHLDIRKE